MNIHPGETIVKQLLYLEDLPFYCHNLKQHIARHSVPGVQYNVVPAYCLEQGFAFLKKNRVDGIIVDVHIPRCTREQLAHCEELPIDLRGYAPGFPGLGLLLMMQQSHEWIAEVPKLVLTGDSFERYATYFDRLKGPKTYWFKESFDEVYRRIMEWLIKYHNI